MNTCNDNHILITWEANLSCPVCHEQKLKNQATLDFYVNGRNMGLTLKIVGYTNTYVHVILCEVGQDHVIKENYIEIMDLFKK